MTTEAKTIKLPKGTSEKVRNMAMLEPKNVPSEKDTVAEVINEEFDMLMEQASRMHRVRTLMHYVFQEMKFNPSDITDGNTFWKEFSHKYAEVFTNGRQAEAELIKLETEQS